MPRLHPPPPATALLALIGTGVLAQDLSLAVAPSHIPNYFGLGIGGAPDYIGSDNYMAGAAPFGRLSLGGERYVTSKAIFSA
jgi:MipA family protein